MEKKKNYNQDQVEKFFSLPKFDLKKIYSHPNFYSDFRKQPINWFLIFIGLAFIVFLLAVEGFVDTTAGRFKLKIGFPILVLILVILIVIQGEWQRFQDDKQIVDVSIYLGFLIIIGITFLFYDAMVTIALGSLIFLVRKYMANRENRLAQALKISN
jgi:hypothetical protein